MMAEQDMRAQGGFHVLELHMASALEGGAALLLLIGAAAGVYLMAKLLKKRSLARQQMTLGLMEEQRICQGREKRMVLAPPGEELPRRPGIPVRTHAQVRPQGFVPIDD
jgi:hypothetical protein